MTPTEQLLDDFVTTFRRRFAPLFGRKIGRQRSEQYLGGLLGGRADRRNVTSLAATVDGATARRLRDAIVADDLGQVRAMLKARPELARSSLELQMLHYAVFNRSPEMVRLLMRHGAPARHGVYPHRDATTSKQPSAQESDRAAARDQHQPVLNAHEKLDPLASYGLLSS